MKSYQKRVVAEESELHERIVRLTAFLGSPSLSLSWEGETGLLVIQLSIMQAYHTTLQARIAHFKGEER